MLVRADIHEGIDSTLMILKNRLQANTGRPEIVVIKEYGQLPLVNCYQSELNQVLYIVNDKKLATDSGPLKRWKFALLIMAQE